MKKRGREKEGEREKERYKPEEGKSEGSRGEVWKGIGQRGGNVALGWGGWIGGWGG